MSSTQFLIKGNFSNTFFILFFFFRAIEKPHPGTSYNPTLKEHNDLLQTVIVNEEKIIKDEAHLDRVTKLLFKRNSTAMNEKLFLREMSAGLPSSNGGKDSDDEDMDDDADEPYSSVTGPAKNKKKSKQTRRNVKEDKEIKHKIQMAKVEKKKIADIYRVKLIEKSIGKEELKLKKQFDHKAKRKEEKKSEPGRIGPMKYVDQEIDIVMPEEMTGNLRNLVPQGQILLDRFKSLQRRNVLPSNQDVGLAKRGKIKRYKRSSHKVLPQQPQKVSKKK